MFSLKGIVAPTFTPMDSDGNLKLSVIPTYADYLYSNDVKAVFVCGTAGEGLSLTVSERKLLTEAWVEAGRRNGLAVIAMVGTAGLADAQQLASHAESVCVDAIATLPPLYDKPTSVSELVDYCAAVSEAAPKTPFFYYHIPFKTQVKLPMEEFLCLGSKRIPLLRGLKFTSDLVTSEGLKCLQPQFTIFVGHDESISKSLWLGFTSAICVCSNLTPKNCSEMFRLAETSKCAQPEERQKIKEHVDKMQERVNNLMKIVFSFTNGFSVSAAKTAMRCLSAIDVGPTRRPVAPLSSADEKAMENALRQWERDNTLVPLNASQ